MHCPLDVYNTLSNVFCFARQVDQHSVFVRMPFCYCLTFYYCLKQTMPELMTKLKTFFLHYFTYNKDWKS